jgi:hypothetical protein
MLVPLKSLKHRVHPYVILSEAKDPYDDTFGFETTQGFFALISAQNDILLVSS